VGLDPTRWDRTPIRPPEHLEELQRAVVDGVQARIVYAGRERPQSERVVHPLGLVAKAHVWYLVAGTDAGLRTFRVSSIRSLELTGDPVDRPPGFDLARTWRSIVELSSGAGRRALWRPSSRPSAAGSKWWSPRRSGASSRGWAPISRA
jgi:predicted DNA-binding transcriptional regulator YafY